MKSKENDCDCKRCEKEFYDELEKYSKERNLKPFDKASLLCHIPIRFLHLPGEKSKNKCKKRHYNK